jgi:hypothetical protein
MKDNLTAEKIAIFGEDFDIPAETLDAYTQRCKAAGLEMDKFFDSLPAWVSEEDQFALWMMQDDERKVWLKANAPVDMTKAKYFSKTLNTSKPVTVGGFRI